MAGDNQPPVVHALAHAMNGALGNTGRSIVFTNPVEVVPIEQMQSLRDLARDMSAGQVDILIVVGGNPVYTAPADLNFKDAMATVPFRVHLSQHVDETSELCHWQIPEAHFLETWSDARAFDGTASIVQPLIAPLYDGRSAHELIAAMSATPEKPAYDLVREHWIASFGPQDAQGSQTAVSGAKTESTAPGAKTPAAGAGAKTKVLLPARRHRRLPQARGPRPLRGTRRPSRPRRLQNRTRCSRPPGAAGCTTASFRIRRSRPAPSRSGPSPSPRRRAPATIRPGWS